MSKVEIPLNTRETLPDQIWMARGEEEDGPEEKPRSGAFETIGENHLYCKPNGGMWTSTYTPDAEYDTDWIRWCSSNGFLAGRHAYRMTPKDDLRIVEVDDLEDLRAVVQRFELEEYGPQKAGWMNAAIDFQSMAEEFDAMRLTEEGQIETRMPGRGEPDLYGWDSECTLWFRWSFEEVEYHGYYDNELPDW